LGQADAFNFTGDNVEAVMSGTTAHIMVTGSAGGGGHETGTMVIYDEGDWLGVFEEMRFIGAGVDAYNSGSYVAVYIPGGGGGGGGSGSYSCPAMVSWYDATAVTYSANATWENIRGCSGTFTVDRDCDVKIDFTAMWGGVSANWEQCWFQLLYDGATQGEWGKTRDTNPYGTEKYTTSMQFVVSVTSGTHSFVMQTHDGGSNLDRAFDRTRMTLLAPLGDTGWVGNLANNVAGTGSVTVYDESVLLGQADAFNFTGDNVEAVMSGTVAHIILDPYLANYTRSGEAIPMATITGGYWQVPDEVYSTGSLAIMINGVWQIPVIDFQEQYPASGTFVIGEEGISTGSFVAAVWGAPV